jgi:hypothetical protein
MHVYMIVQEHILIIINYFFLLFCEENLEKWEDKIIRRIIRMKWRKSLPPPKILKKQVKQMNKCRKASLFSLISMLKNAEKFNIVEYFF